MNRAASLSRPILMPPTFGSTSSTLDPFRTIAVLMSGGVDSSVTAWLLQQQGWQVVGITMKLPEAQGCRVPRPCCGADAAMVCHHLNLPHYFIDAQEVFRDQIIKPFREAYLSGRTPSPCVDCNSWLKFGVVWDVIREELGIEYLATGHYARLSLAGRSPKLGRGVDAARDQSYFLHGIQSTRLLFLRIPLCAYTKEQVRIIAVDLGLPVAKKPDSMELCFAGEEDYRHLLTDTPSRPGPVVDPEGRMIGNHKGIHHYTIGQRRGLGIANEQPLYVLRILPETNTIIAGHRDALLTHDIHASGINVLQPDKLQEGAVLQGKIRSIGRSQVCRVIRWDSVQLHVQFNEPVFAPAPGQRLVLYDTEDYLVAGGEMEASELVVNITSEKQVSMK